MLHVAVRLVAIVLGVSPELAAHMQREQRIEAARQYLANARFKNSDELMELVRYFNIAQKEKSDGKWRKKTRRELREELGRFVDASAGQPGGDEPSGDFVAAPGAKTQA